MKILCIGDTYGEPGRKAIELHVNNMKKKGEVDFVVCNAENAASGAGITGPITKELFAAGCDVLTCGDHVFDHRKDIEETLKNDPRVLRPANFPKGAPGSGSTVVECKGVKVGVVHVAGQVFMRFHFSSPFFSADEEIEKVRKAGAQIILVDMHGEATSEKTAISWYLDGRVSAVVGTHTHVQTADERILPEGTAYITDVGMTGPRDGVIGMAREGIIERFLTQLPVRFQVATGAAQLNGVLIDVAGDGRAQSIERIALIDES
jgi:metallophosphoesterase (TIGR00282 family)